MNKCTHRRFGTEGQAEMVCRKINLKPETKRRLFVHFCTACRGYYLKGEGTK